MGFGGRFSRGVLVIIGIALFAGAAGAAISFAEDGERGDGAAIVEGAWEGQDSASGEMAASFKCGGALEEKVWRLWDNKERQFLRAKLIDIRLKADGDTYSLYEAQMRYQGLGTMASRCGRKGRLLEIARELLRAFEELEPVANAGRHGAWICRSGGACSASASVNKELVLASSQFLGWVGEIAKELAASPEEVARSFVALTAEVLAEHLARWGNEAAVDRWVWLRYRMPEEVRPNDSSLLFSDREMWQVVMYANLAGILVLRPDVREGIGREEIGKLRHGLVALLELLRSRITILRDRGAVGQNLERADLDRGFWRLYSDGRYAGYSGMAPPAICEKTEKGQRLEFALDMDEVPIVETLGWDISHARRLVNLVRALEVNGGNMEEVYEIPRPLLKAVEVGRGLATQLVERVWNGKRDIPLFSNYWNGTNGWYRVGYGMAKGGCFVGFEPHGLSDTFLTGGYVEWERYEPIIGKLGRRLFAMIERGDDVASSELRRYYFRMSRDRERIMYWPNLVAAG